MQQGTYKTIDAKIKEIYFEARPLKEPADTIESRYKFWNCLNVMAMQNMTLQQLKTKVIV